jgi:hypothetical protein
MAYNKGMKVLDFLQYNNAVPIAVSVLILGAGSTFAATNLDAIYSQTETTVSIDNTYIVNKDLSSYSPQAQIVAVTEDADNYYVAYKFFTIDLQNGVWQDVVKDQTMTVSKALLGQYRDLGLYVTDQLKENVDAELARLRNTQDIEKKSVTQKVVATTYGGLIGKMLNTTTETLPGYTPVVQESSLVGAAAALQGGVQTQPSQPQSGPAVGLQLLGNNPAVVPLNTNYSDLGAVLIDPLHQNVGIHVFQDGAEVSLPAIDTSTTSVATIEYRATDHNGMTVVVRRVVLVGGAPDPGGEISSAGNTAISAPPSTPANTSASSTTQTSSEPTSATSTVDTDQAPDTSAASSTDAETAESSATTTSESAGDAIATTTPAQSDVETPSADTATSSPAGETDASSTPAL